MANKKNLGTYHKVSASKSKKKKSSSSKTQTKKIIRRLSKKRATELINSLAPGEGIKALGNGEIDFTAGRGSISIIRDLDYDEDYIVSFSDTMWDGVRWVARGASSSEIATKEEAIEFLRTYASPSTLKRISF